MAACELKGELKYRDGQTSQFTVQADGDLKSMITGIKKFNADISEVLTALVEQERGSAQNSTADVDGKLIKLRLGCLLKTNRLNIK